MRIQVLFALAGAIFPVVCQGDSSLPDCFDFSREIREGPAHRKTVKLTGELRSSGELPSGVVWAAAQDQTTKSISDLLEELASHEKTKSARVDDLVIQELNNPAFLRHQKVKFEVHPFPFITVAWTEDWAFTLIEGTRDRPRRVLVAYEKTDGTTHIKRLCGSYELRLLPSGRTEIFLYEEAKATSRSREDTLSGLLATLAQFH